MKQKPHILILGYKIYCALILFILFNSHVSAQQTSQVHGSVTSAESNISLIGVTVLVKGTSNGTVTDSKGGYSIQAEADDTLIFRYIGYQEMRIPVNGRTIINVAMRTISNRLNDLVVTGYFDMSKRDVTGAASTVPASVIAQTPVTDVGTALQGRVAGVSVDDQGGPGSAAVVRIRGIGTLGNNNPLYVIDGVQVRIENSSIADLINPGDIESITVLKDPSLTSLYGAEGSNGVIVITTKKGKLGGPRLEYSSYVADQMPIKLPKMITPGQQANALYNSYVHTNQTFPYASFYGNGTAPVLPDYIIEGATPNTGVSAGDPGANPSLYNFLNYRILKSNKSGTNWWTTLFRPALSQNHQLDLSGASEKSNYAITFNYNNTNGTLLNTYFKRLSLRANTEFRIKPWLKIGENFDFAYTSGNSIGGRGFNNQIADLYGLPGLLPTHDIAGNIAGLGGVPVLGDVSNPLIDQTNAVNSKNYTEGIIGSAYLEVEPLKGITLQSKIGVQLVPGQYHSLSDSVIQNPIPIHQTYFYEGSNYYTDWRWTNKIAYSATFNHIHKITAFAAVEAREYKSRYLSLSVDNLISTAPNFQYINGGFADPNFPPQGSGIIQTNLSEFGNISYSLMDRYLLSATLRHDGSSIFGVNKKYGTFPALSAGWRISDEKFMQSLKWINDLKLRASWGKAGNDAIPSSEQYSLINATDFIFGGYDLNGTNVSQVLGAYPSQVGNPNLSWETNVTTNVGFDAALFQNRLTAGFNWFDRKTSGLLYQAPFPGTAGAASAPYRNIMSFSNKGIELELGFNGGHSQGLRYDMNFNISTYRSNVDYINGDSATHIDLATYAPTHYQLTRNMVGHPVSSFYGYVYDGIFQDSNEVKNSPAQPGITPANGTGHVKFKDLSGPGGKPDNQIDANDETFIGNPNPKFSFGYNLDLYFKNFDFNIFLQGVYGNKIFNYWRSFAEWPGDLTAGSLDTWSPSNKSAKLPIYTQDGINNNYDNVPSSFFVEDGSYLRVKMLQLGYTFPKTKIFTRLRVYVQVFNILTLTHYSGLDPEVNSGDPGSLGIDYGTQYPLSKKVLLGVNLDL